MAIKTILTYELNGSTTEFEVPFEYLSRRFVKVLLIGGTRRELTLNVDYRFINKNTIKTTQAWGNAQGFKYIEIRRVTSATDRIVDFMDGSILRASDLNASQIQALHVAEEARDLTADSLYVNEDGNLDARGRRIINLGNTVGRLDAVNKAYIDDAKDGVIQSRDKALQYRNEAQGFRNEAEQFKNQAETYKTKAETAKTDADAAKGIAVTKASEASSSATKAVEAMSSAQKSATNAINSEKKAKASETEAAGSAKRAEDAAAKAVGGGIPMVNLVQDLGQRTDFVISQKVVTDSLNSKVNKDSITLEVDDIQSMLSMSLSRNTVIKVLGFYAKGDGAYHYRVISDVSDDSSIRLNNGLYANLLDVDLIDLKHIGVKGDGIQDDTIYIQKALAYCFNKNKSLVGGKYKCKITSTIFIPNFFNSKASITSLDFKGLTIEPSPNVNVCFESGKFTDGTWVSAFNERNETFMSFNTIISNLTFDNKTGVKDSKVALKIKDLHYGCVLENINGLEFSIFIHAKNCFSSSFDTCSVYNKPIREGDTGIGFLFEGPNNLMKCRRLVANHCDVGYKLQGMVDAFSFDTCSFEGQNIGLHCTDIVYSINVNNCYSENVVDTVFKFDGSIRAAMFENNYINARLGAYLFDYIPSREMGIRWSASNGLLGLPNNKFIKNVNNDLAIYNTVFVEKHDEKMSTLEDLIVNNTEIPKGVDLYQRKLLHVKNGVTHIKANVINELIPANYSGKMSNGYLSSESLSGGFQFVVQDGTNIRLKTKILKSETARIYMNVRVATFRGYYYYKGDIFADNSQDSYYFLEITKEGYKPNDAVTVIVEGDYLTINIKTLSTVSKAEGEVRVI